MRYVLKCRWISGERFGRAQDKWWPGNWGGERERRERGKAGSDEEGLSLPSVHPSKACLIHSHHAHTSPWKPAAPACEICPLLYLYTFPHPQPCFAASSFSPRFWGLWRNTKSVCLGITLHLKHVSNMCGEVLVGIQAHRLISLHWCFFMRTKGWGNTHGRWTSFRTALLMEETCQHFAEQCCNTVFISTVADFWGHLNEQKKLIMNVSLCWRPVSITVRYASYRFRLASLTGAPALYCVKTRGRVNGKFHFKWMKMIACEAVCLLTKIYTAVKKT